MTLEATIRAALRVDVAGGDTSVVAVDEFWIPRSHERADLVVLSSALDAYEIKTSRDTLRRLARQVPAYGRVFDLCTAVVAEKHLAHVEALLPVWWGIKVIEGEHEISFTQVREPRPNAATDRRTLVRLLWRDEAAAALESLGHSPSPSESRSGLWDELLRRTTAADLASLVRRALVTRDPARARIPTRRFATPVLA